MQHMLWVGYETRRKPYRTRQCSPEINPISVVVPGTAFSFVKIRNVIMPTANDIVVSDLKHDNDQER